MKLIPALAALSALLLPRALPADTFEGKLSMTITSSSKDETHTIDMSMKNGLVRTDMETPRGIMSAIVDTKNRQVTVLMPQQKMYMVQKLPDPSSLSKTGPDVDANAYSLTDTGMKETILGYSCAKYVATGPKGSSELWVTDQLGTFAGIFQGPGGRGSMAPPAWEQALKGKNFFPLRVVTTVGGDKTFRMDVVSVQKTSLSDSLFAPPAGWRKFDIGAMMNGAMSGGLPGARPPPADN